MGGGHGDPSPSSPSSARPASATILLVAGLVALLGIGIGAMVATGALSGGGHASAAPRASFSASSTSAAKPAPSAPTPSELSGDRRAIMVVLDDYKRAFSNHDIQGLSSIFAPQVARRGLAAGGCTVSHGREAVLADYRSQFEQGSGSYELVGLSENDVQFSGGTEAHVDAHYRVTPGGAGYVDFRLTELGEGWRISEVHASCH
jgi:hypothetical protein